jgi:hypothetical protein
MSKTYDGPKREDELARHRQVAKTYQPSSGLFPTDLNERRKWFDASLLCAQNQICDSTSHFLVIIIPSLRIRLCEWFDGNATRKNLVAFLSWHIPKQERSFDKAQFFVHSANRFEPESNRSASAEFDPKANGVPLDGSQTIARQRLPPRSVIFVDLRFAL